jgi:hypothetical protein
MTRASISVQRIEQSILILRGQKVLLDAELAALYGVETRVLVQAVKRNVWRFPEDFMFQLTTPEPAILRSLSVISRWGGRQRNLREYRTDERCSLPRATLFARM